MHPILFTIPFINLPIFSYGVMLGLSLIVGWMIVMHLGEQDGLPKDKMAACFIVTAVSAIAGARILYIVTNLDQYQGAGMVDFFNMQKGGLVAYGGFLGGFLGSWGYLKLKKIHLLPWADVVVITLSSGLMITRMGCLLFGCDYGRPVGDTASGFLKAIAIRFPNWDVKYAALKEQFAEAGSQSLGVLQGAPAYLHHAHDGLVEHGAAFSAYVYPTQIISSLNGLIILVGLLLLRKRTTFRGQLFCVFTMYYGVTRALIEAIRGDTGRGAIGLFSTSQIIGFATCAAALGLYFFLKQKAKQNPEAAMALGPGAVIPQEEAPAESKSPQPQKKKSKSKKKKRK